MISWITITLLIGLVGLVIGRYLVERKAKREYVERHERARKKMLTDLVENQEDRTLTDEYSEEEFWERVEKTQKRSGYNHNNFNGIFSDVVHKLSGEEIIKLDNLYDRLVRENINHDVMAASAIIFKTSELNKALVLMNLMMMRGEIFFKNCCNNPNLLIGKEMDDIRTSTISDICADAYLAKEDKFIPEIVSPEMQIPGEPWKMKELPKRYHELWQEFA